MNGAHTLTLVTDLPSLGEAVVIDGSSEPDFTGSPVVQLTDGGASTTVGLTLAGNGITVRGLSFTGFSDRALQVSGNNNVVVGNWIGIAPDGSAPAQHNYHGIVIGGSDNLVGRQQRDRPQRDRLRGLLGHHAQRRRCHEQPQSAATTSACWPTAARRPAWGTSPSACSTTPTATSSAPTATGVGDAGEGNVIGSGWSSLGNGGLTTLTVAGNRFGLNAAGAASAGGGGYLEVTNGTTVRIGTDGDGTSDALEANVFAGSLVIAGAVSDLSIAGNFIGVATDGITPLGNAGAGVVVSGNASGTVGGTSATLANTIAHNGGDGIEVTGTGASLSILGNNAVRQHRPGYRPGRQRRHRQRCRP